MPNRTIYIRNEDLPLWDNLKDKPKFIHQALNGQSGLVEVENLGDVFDNKLCPHHMLWGECGYASCKK